MAHTPDGYLWVGTRGGLARFDGVRFRNYGLADGLKSLAISSLIGDGQGGLWIGTRGGGLSRWRDGVISTLLTTDGLAHNDVMALASTEAGAVWVGSKGGLQHFGPNGFSPVVEFNGFHGEVVALAADSSGGVWMTTSPSSAAGPTGPGHSGLYYFKEGRCVPVDGPAH
jgi:ligand-binding sensor domain-containing protein